MDKIINNKRASVAHDILKIRPTEKMYNDLLNKFKKETEKRYLIELSKSVNEKKYNKEIINKWNEFVKFI